ncbi:MAG: hypothetical protein PHW03_09840 [Eubacteriales bacterium]|nr:hypothetical protein [Eubacteriales bacterium]
MKNNIYIFGLLLTGLLLCSPALALTPIPFNPSNTSAEQLGGLYNPYVFANGDDTFEVFTVVPLTTQNVAYPIEIFYAVFFVGVLFLAIGVIATSKSDSVPSLTITACGIIVFGCFMICALMLPYTAYLHVNEQVIQNVDKFGVGTGNNSVYITQIADYRASTWMSWMCYGFSIAGLIMMILGTLSFIGWFARKGIRDAANGKYLETEDGESSYRGVGRKL